MTSPARIALIAAILAASAQAQELPPPAREIAVTMPCWRHDEIAGFIEKLGSDRQMGGAARIDGLERARVETWGIVSAFGTVARNYFALVILPDGTACMSAWGESLRNLGPRTKGPTK